MLSVPVIPVVVENLLFYLYILNRLSLVFEPIEIAFCLDE
jgi:hypothetical protein